MQGIIWYYGPGHRDVAVEQLERIIQGYEVGQHILVEKRINCLSTQQVYFENGDRWTICPSHENSRGRRCNISLVDADTPQDILEKVINHVTTAPPYRAIDFWRAE